MTKRSIVSMLLMVVASIHLTAQVDQKHSINTGWRFIKENVPEAFEKEFNDSNWELVNVPHTYNTVDVIDDELGYYRGIAWYRKEFFLPNSCIGKKVSLWFEGVAQKCEIYLNGRYLGEHIGGYTSFVMDIEGIMDTDQMNVLSVKVDNSDNMRFSIPPVSGDFSMFGGIYRDVFITIKDKTYFNHNFYASSGAFWQTPKVSSKEAEFKLFGQIAHEHYANRNIELHHKILDNKNKQVWNSEQALLLKTGRISSFEKTGRIADPHLWSPDTPYVYQLISEIRDAKTKLVLDRVSNPIGFRHLELDNERGFFINGKACKLNGAARHQDYMGMGTALSDPMHFRDMQLLKDMGANFVRISHYPQDKAIYDACDKLGIMSWSEIPTVNWVPYGNPFLKNSLEMMREMVFQNYNHPSVIIWGYHNEVWQVHEDAVAHARTMENFVREEDPHRLTAIAYHGVLNENYFASDLDKEMFNTAMINGFNLYTGWYWGELDEVGEMLSKLRSLSPQTPIMLSEYGAGCDTRIHTYSPSIHDFSVQYQTDLHHKYYTEGSKLDYMIGFAIWNFIDFQRDGRGDAKPNENNKGMITTDRKKKDSYYYYKANWNKDPFIHIEESFWKKRVELSDAKGVVRPIRVFSNLKEIELLNNGISQGVANTVGGIAQFEVEYKDGINQLKATSVDNHVEDFLSIDYSFISTNIKDYGIPVEGICLNLGQTSTFFHDTNSDEVWLPCPKYKSGGIGYLDGEIYHKPYENKPALRRREGIAHNIVNTHIDPVYQTFVQDISQFKAEVPDGTYKVTLLFTEPFYENSKILSPEEKAWGVTKDPASIDERMLDVAVNGQVVHNVQPAISGGANKAMSVDFIVDASNNEGLTITLDAKSGKTLLCGVKIKQF